GVDVVVEQLLDPGVRARDLELLRHAAGLLRVAIAQRHQLEPLGPLERRDVADLRHRSDADEADPEVLTRHELAPYRGCTLGRAFGAVKRDGRALRRGETVAAQLLEQAL